MPSLDDRLAASRAHLLDDINQPELTQIVGRARQRRLRRRVSQAGTALLAVAVVAVLVARPWAGTAGPQPPTTTPDPTPTAGTVYTDRGITVNGLYRNTTDLPGVLRDAEFTDPDHGWVLAADCGERCRLTVAGTDDGGLTWTVHPIGETTIPTNVPDLVALDASTLLLHGVAGSLLSTDAGASWRDAGGSGPAVTTIDTGARLLLRPGPTAGCAGRVVEVWARGYAYRRDLLHQPDIDVCWVAAKPASDGAWWVGGTDRTTGQPAVSVSRDGGTTWQHQTFAEPGDWAEVTWLGNDTYAAVVSRDGKLQAIYHSARLGTPLSRMSGAPQSIGGEPVPLLDGRLLLASGKTWYVSDSAGATFATTHNLPQVGRLARTPAGYLAFDIVADGWAAYSSDGSTWRKLHIH